jgi:hypothetical protein
MAPRAFGAAVGAGFEAATEPEFDPLRIGLAAGTGAMLKPTRIGEAVMAPGERLGAIVGERLGTFGGDDHVRGQRSAVSEGTGLAALP